MDFWQLTDAEVGEFLAVSLAISKGTANVSPGDMAKLKPLLAHYAKKAHPFAACKTDQLKHGLSEGHANRRCAVLKDLIKGTTKWRGKGKELSERGEDGLAEEFALSRPQEVLDAFSGWAASLSEEEVSGMVSELSAEDENYGVLRTLAGRLGISLPYAEEEVPELSADPPEDPLDFAAKGMTAAKYDPDAWARATLLHDVERYGEEWPGDRSKHRLPVRKPDGTLDLDAMKEAERKLLTLTSEPQDRVRRAARELLRFYREVDDNPPDSLRGLAGDSYRDFSAVLSGGEAEDASYLLPLDFSAPAETETVELGSKKEDGSPAKGYWKNLLPIGRKIAYTGQDGVKRTLHFTKAAVQQAVQNLKSNATGAGAVPYVMVRGNNTHGDEPELARGVIKDGRVKGRFLQVLVEPRTKEAAEFLSNFPEVGVSAKWHPDYYREADGKRFGPTILHAAATWRPHIPNLGLWQAAKLSAEELPGLVPEAAFVFSNDEEVIDLSNARIDDGKEAKEGGDNMRFKIKKRDGKLVKVFEDNTTAELSQEERDLFAQEFGARDEGPTVAELSERLNRSEMARKTQDIEHRIETYERRGMKPAITQRLLKPIAMFAAAEEDRTVEVVNLSTKDGAPQETRTNVPLQRHVWNLADALLGELGDAGALVDLSAEQGDSGAAAEDDKNADQKIRERMKESNLSYDAAAVELAGEGVIDLA